MSDPLEYIDALEEMFATQGWRNLIEEAKAQAYQYQADALECKSWEQVCELRGQVLQLSRLVNLEQVTSMMKAQYLAEREDEALDADL